MVTDMKPILIALSMLLLVAQSPTSALGSELANDCKKTACINVYTDNNQIIIEAKKGGSTVKKTIAQAPRKPVVKAKPTTKPRPLFLLPLPKVKPVVKKPTVKTTRKRPTKP
ncbi:MAG: hypothetical protein RL144_1230, partial [Actinomycetota bacterium]